MFLYFIVFFFRKLNKNHNNNIITIYILKIQVATVYELPVYTVSYTAA